jgi:hypothetical protein
MPRRSTVRAATTVGIDMGKNTLHRVGLDLLGAIVLRERVSRGRITSRLANLPPCLIGIEAGMGTHYVARELAALGHDVKQVPPARMRSMARNTNIPFKGQIQKRKIHYLQIITFGLQRAAGPYRRGQEPTSACLSDHLVGKRRVRQGPLRGA